MEGREGEARLTVLVTGVGAPPGVSIFKACRQSALRPRVVATDADPASVGLFRADAAYVVPRIARDEGAYLEQMESICVRERVSAIFFGSEEEMRLVAPHAAAIETRTRARPVVNAPSLIDTFMDKWGMFLAMREKGLPVPDTVLATDPEAVRWLLARHPLPLILKPRRGSGSKGLSIVRNADTIGSLSRLVPDPVLQEYLHPEDEEYTRVRVEKDRPRFSIHWLVPQEGYIVTVDMDGKQPAEFEQFLFPADLPKAEVARLNQGNLI